MAILIKDSGVHQRKPGYTPATSVEVIAGQPIQLAPSDTTGATIMLANGTSSIIGFALETNISSASPSQYYDNYNRGGLISAVVGNGVEIDIWNDGTGAPYDTALTYAIGQNLYVSTAGLVSNVVNGDVIGNVTKVPTSATDALRLQIKL